MHRDAAGIGAALSPPTTPTRHQRSNRMGEFPTHCTQIKVRGYHLDLYGHVNNARYLEFLEEARWQWVEEKADLGGLLERGMGFSVVNININYRRPAYLGEILEIESGIKVLGNRSGIVRQVVTLLGTDTVVADADVTFVIVSRETGKALPLAGELRELFAAGHGSQAGPDGADG
jgi:thioesterase-3